MEALSKVKALDILATYGHVFMGATSMPLDEVIERVDWHAENQAEATAFAAKLRHATRQKGQRVWFPSMADGGGMDSVLDVSGKSTTVYKRHQCLIVHTVSQFDSGSTFVNSTVYFIPGIEPAPVSA